jgi:protein TonB
VFEDVTRKQGGRRAARRGAFLFGSTVTQIAFVAVLVFAGERIRAAVKSEPVVEVKFVKAATPRPPPPPAPPPARKPPSERPKTEVKKVPPMAMIQPKTVQEEMKPPDPNEPEEDYDYDGEGEGVVGGVVGGTAPAPGPAQRGFEEAPKYVTSGFRPPKLVNRTCLAENVHLPPQLFDVVSGPITVKFAVYSNGSVGSIQILTQVPDPRISEAIKHAIGTCEWVPGADAQGHPTALWVIQPFRFAD